MRSNLIVLFTLICFQGLLSQEKREVEKRINRQEFPQQALNDIAPYLEESRKVRYYKEIDGAKTSFEIKLKKGRLTYSVEFDPQGELEDVEIGIRKIDIPEESYSGILKDLERRFTRFKIRKIQQQYPHIPPKPVSQTLRDAFQNLLLPDLRYEIIVGGKEIATYQTYEFLYDAQGGFLHQRVVVSSDKRYVLY